MLAEAVSRARALSQWLLQIARCKDRGLLVKIDRSGGSDPGYDRGEGAAQPRSRSMSRKISKNRSSSSSISRRRETGTYKAHLILKE